MIKCGGYRSFNGEYTEYDCKYSPDFDCGDCILNGGTMSPISGKKFRGNRAQYEKRARTAFQQPKPETLDINIKNLFRAQYEKRARTK